MLSWRYWPNVGCYEFSFERTVFFELSNGAVSLPNSGSELGKSLNRLIGQYIPRGAATCSERFCKMFSESFTGSWAELQLPCCPSKQGELLENILQSGAAD